MLTRQLASIRALDDSLVRVNLPRCRAIPNHAAAVCLANDSMKVRSGWRLSLLLHAKRKNEVLATSIVDINLRHPRSGSRRQQSGGMALLLGGLSGVSISFISLNSNRGMG
jgi:hypothetical protein